LVLRERGVDVDQRGAPGKQRLDLDHRDERGDAGQQRGRRDHRAGAVDHLRQRHAVPGQLADLVADERDRLGRAERRAAGQPPPREVGGGGQQQALVLTGRQVHAGPPAGPVR